jgi:hypothetical protein
MPRTRTLLRAVSRDDQRAAASPSPNPGHGMARAQRRKNGWRGDISARLNGPHPMRRRPFDVAALIAGKMPTSGQGRVNAKRNDRAHYQAEFGLG